MLLQVWWWVETSWSLSTAWIDGAETLKSWMTRGRYRRPGLVWAEMLRSVSFGLDKTLSVKEAHSHVWLELHKITGTSRAQSIGGNADLAANEISLPARCSFCFTAPTPSISPWVKKGTFGNNVNSYRGRFADRMKDFLCGMRCTRVGKARKWSKAHIVSRKVFQFVLDLSTCTVVALNRSIDPRNRGVLSTR